MTLIIIIISSLFSIAAFNKPELMHRFQFNAYKIYHNKQWYRLITHAFLHGDWTHLIINMLVLLSFGKALEYIFEYYLAGKATLYYLILYFGGIIISSLYSIKKNKDNIYYNAVGASGAVSAVVFCSIFFQPMHKILFFGIIPIPGIIFGVLYLLYSYQMSKKSMDNIGHDAHFWGAIFGFIFPLLIDINYINVFINNLFNY